ncbi:copper transporter [Clostridiaceae bacterium 35-E11]
MTINLKYYVMTIVAIFLAIGIGIFIGIMLDGQDLIVEQQHELVYQIESKFDEFKLKQDELQGKIDNLTLQREKNQKFIDTIYPEIVDSKLKDLNVVILETSEYFAYSGLADAFKKAGVNNVTNILIQNPFMLKEEDNIRQIAQELNLEGETREEIQKSLIQKLSNTLITGEQLDFVKNLKDKQMIDFTEDFHFPIDYIVIAGGSINSDKVILNKIEIPLIEYVKKRNIPIMAVENSNMTFSNIPDYKKLRISTVDNVDTVIGKVAMLMVASGQEGHFGEKETAEKLIPQGFINVD